MESYDDPAKRLAREKFYEFILKHLINEAKIPVKKIKVVCLETPEALEIKEIYDRLRIPRANIIVIEREPSIAKKIEAQNLGVTVINCWDYEFFKRTEDGPFHIISLDYKGIKSFKIIDTIELVATRQLLTSPGILLVNCLAAREKGEYKKYLNCNLALRRGVNIYKSNKGNESNIFSRETFQEKILESLKNMSTPEEVFVNESRDLFTSIIIQTMSRGTDAIFTESDFFMCYPDSFEISEYLKSTVVKNGIKTSNPDKMFGFLHADNMIIHIMKLLPIPRGFAEMIFESLSVYLTYSYITRNIARYRYISQNGAPMELDIFLFKRYDNIIRQIKDLFVLKKNYEHNGRLILRLKDIAPFFNIGKKSKRKIKLLDTYLQDKKKGRIITDNYPERIHLGSSSQIKNMQSEVIPQTQTEDNDSLSQTQKGDIVAMKKNTKKSAGNQISKKEAIDLLKMGWTPKRISENFSGFTKMQLAAFKAHITMGTYD